MIGGYREFLVIKRDVSRKEIWSLVRLPNILYMHFARGRLSVRNARIRKRSHQLKQKLNRDGDERPLCNVRFALSAIAAGIACSAIFGTALFEQGIREPTLPDGQSYFVFPNPRSLLTIVGIGSAVGVLSAGIYLVPGVTLAALVLRRLRSQATTPPMSRWLVAALFALSAIAGTVVGYVNRGHLEF